MKILLTRVSAPIHVFCGTNSATELSSLAHMIKCMDMCIVPFRSSFQKGTEVPLSHIARSDSSINSTQDQNWFPFSVPVDCCEHGHFLHLHPQGRHLPLLPSTQLFPSLEQRLVRDEKIGRSRTTPTHASIGRNLPSLL
jgi:hypothetical protein